MARGTETGEYWFLTKDATAAEPYSGIDRGNLEELVTWRKLHARRRVMLIDTCYSGLKLDEHSDARGGRAIEQATVDTLREREGIYVLAASADDEFAREQQGNGVFTRVLLDGLEGQADKNHDGLVDIEEIKTYASSELHVRSGGKQHPTFPKVEGGESFPLARTLRDHLDGILAWTRIRVTNGALEGMNNKIKVISHRAFGYRTLRVSRTRPPCRQL
jgi:hypothetical protein